MKKNRTVSDKLNEKIQTEAKALVEEYNAETDPVVRVEIQYDVASKIRKTLIVEISAMTDKDWRLFLREQTKPLEKWIEKTAEDILEQKLRQGAFGLKDISLLYTHAELADRSTRWTRSETVALKKRRTIERLFALFGLSYVAMAFQTGITALSLEPLLMINSLVSRRFGADSNWTLAATILATHENLVKKKLSILGRSEKEIEGISRNEGFSALIGVLATEIERKEKRKVSLTFYRASALRSVRNRVEHEGYKTTVTREEVLDLVKDTNRFELELFPNPTK